MSNRPIHVIVVHDDYVCRTGLTAAFAECDDMRVQATSQDDPALLSCDVVVTDFDNGIRILASTHPLQLKRASAKVAIVANAEREWQIRDALKRGAAGFLPLGSSAEELYVAVRTVHRGECHLSPSIAARLATSLATEPLTEREGQVLTLLTDGLCNKHIASRLDISVGTVKAHLRSAFDKLGVHSRTEAILIAERRGMLRHPRPSRLPAAPTPVQAVAVPPRPRPRRGDPFVNMSAPNIAPVDA